VCRYTTVDLDVTNFCMTKHRNRYEHQMPDKQSHTWTHSLYQTEYPGLFCKEHYFLSAVTIFYSRKMFPYAPLSNFSTHMTQRSTKYNSQLYQKKSASIGHRFVKVQLKVSSRSTLHISNWFQKTITDTYLILNNIILQILYTIQVTCNTLFILS
jgi:hypothetical protein